VPADVADDGCQRCLKEHHEWRKQCASNRRRGRSTAQITYRFSDINDMDPEAVRHLPVDQRSAALLARARLPELSQAEEMLIALAMPIMKVYRLKGGQRGFKGNVINLPQDIAAMVQALPRLPRDLPMIVVRRHLSADPADYKDFQVRD
jgi:hypothetical protein